MTTTMRWTNVSCEKWKAKPQMSQYFDTMVQSIERQRWHSQCTPSSIQTLSSAGLHDAILRTDGRIAEAVKLGLLKNLRGVDEPLSEADCAKYIGAFPDDVLVPGRTPVMTAIWVNSMDALQLLRNAGANFTNPCQLDNGRTAFHFAVMLNRLDMVKYILPLIPRQRLLDRTFDGDTALHVACRCGNFHFITLLLQHAASMYIEEVFVWKQLNPNEGGCDGAAERVPPPSSLIRAMILRRSLIDGRSVGHLLASAGTPEALAALEAMYTASIEHRCVKRFLFDNFDINGELLMLAAATPEAFALISQWYHKFAISVDFAQAAPADKTALPDTEDEREFIDDGTDLDDLPSQQCAADVDAVTARFTVRLRLCGSGDTILHLIVRRNLNELVPLWCEFLVACNVCDSSSIGLWLPLLLTPNAAGDTPLHLAMELPSAAAVLKSMLSHIHLQHMGSCSQQSAAPLSFSTVFAPMLQTKNAKSELRLLLHWMAINGHFESIDWVLQTFIRGYLDQLTSHAEMIASQAPCVEEVKAIVIASPPQLASPSAPGEEGKDSSNRRGKPSSPAASYNSAAAKEEAVNAAVQQCQALASLTQSRQSCFDRIAELLREVDALYCRFINAVDHDGFSPLMLACQFNRPKCVASLAAAVDFIGAAAGAILKSMRKVADLLTAGKNAENQALATADSLRSNRRASNTNLQPPPKKSGKSAASPSSPSPSTQQDPKSSAVNTNSAFPLDAAMEQSMSKSLMSQQLDNLQVLFETATPSTFRPLMIEVIRYQEDVSQCAMGPPSPVHQAGDMISSPVNRAGSTSPSAASGHSNEYEGSRNPSPVDDHGRSNSPAGLEMGSVARAPQIVQMPSYRDLRPNLFGRLLVVTVWFLQTHPIRSSTTPLLLSCECCSSHTVAFIASTLAERREYFATESEGLETIAKVITPLGDSGISKLSPLYTSVCRGDVDAMGSLLRLMCLCFPKPRVDGGPMQKFLYEGVRHQEHVHERDAPNAEFLWKLALQYCRSNPDRSVAASTAISAVPISPFETNNVVSDGVSQTTAPSRVLREGCLCCGGSLRNASCPIAISPTDCRAKIMMVALIEHLEYYLAPS